MKKTHLTQESFEQFGLHPKVLVALDKANFNYCTPIQALTLPIALQGRDVAGQAQTGTGKTIAFLVATFHHLLEHQRVDSNPRAIILAPTRELAVQIHKDAQLLAEETGFHLALVYGGDNYEGQKRQFDKPVDILIGTIGRVIDFYKQQCFTLDQIRVTVLDEADRMFDLGFIKDIRYLFRRLPEKEQRLNLLFSATLSYKVQELAFEYMNQPESLTVASDTLTNASIGEELLYPSQEHKLLLLLTLLEEEWPDKCIIFANTKYSCEEVHSWLVADKHRVGLLTGDIKQQQRLKVLQQFTEGQLDFLVATDVAARGLHIPDVTHVINFDLPDDPEDYVHRIGRTGRAGAKGHAISFACEKYAYNLDTIQQYIGYTVAITQYDETALLSDVTPPPKIRYHKNLNQHRKPKTPRKNYRPQRRKKLP